MQALTSPDFLKIMHKVNLVHLTYLRVIILALQDTPGMSSQPTNNAKQSFIWKYGEPMPDSAMQASISSIPKAHEALDLFLTVDEDDIDVLPTIFFGRITYTIIYMIFLHLRSIGPDKKTASINTESLRVSEYLNRFNEKLSGLKIEECGSAIRKFSTVLTTFKSWFERQKDGPKRLLPNRGGKVAAQLQAEPVDSEKDAKDGYRKLSVHSDTNSDTGSKSALHSSTSQNPTTTTTTGSSTSANNPKPTARTAQMGAATPLHLLSQVASNEQSATTTSNQVPTDQWYSPYSNEQPYTADGYYPDPPSNFSNINAYGIDNNHGVDVMMEQLYSAFGSEGNMMGTLFNGMLAMDSVSAQNGMPYGGWYTQEQ
jgi:hypothetical protein